jgi:hypothetical protein
VTHPPDTKVCIHCGGRVARGRDAAPAAPFQLPAPRDEGAEAEAAERGQAARPLRIAIAVLWLVLALAGTLWQRCQHAP